MVACLSLFLMAAAEEFLIRGLILSAFLKKYGAQNMIRAVLVSAILFSVMHLVNLFRMNMAEVFIQMIIAFFFGVFFGALMMKTKNLFYLSIIHGIINICFSLDAVLRKTSVKKTVDSWQEILAAIGTTTLILSPLFIIGFLILRNMKKEELRKLAIVNQ